jgi:F0F1-type ATP synthase delta subunit
MNKKQLLKLINKAVEDSVVKGKIDTVKVSKYIKFFKSLPLDDAITAMEAYSKGLKRVSVQQTLFIYSPISLNTTQINNFKNYFQKNHQISSTKVIIDTSLLGGVMFKIGDTVYDNTVRSKIEQVAEAIAG